MNDELCNKPRQIDSFYLVKCKWPQQLTATTKKESLYQVEEIMSKYRECFIRHNSLVEELTNGS